MLIYRGMAIAFAVLAPLGGIAFALNHQLDLLSAILCFGALPAGCVGMYFFSRWFDRAAERMLSRRDMEMRGRF